MNDGKELEFEFDPVWAVIDPMHPKGGLWIACLGTDALRLESTRIHENDLHGDCFFKVRVRSLTPTQLLRLCRCFSELSGGVISEAGAFLEATQGHGLFVAMPMVHVSNDPTEGRERFASRARKEGGGDA